MKEHTLIENCKIGMTAPDGSGKTLSLYGCQENKMSFEELIKYVSDKNMYSNFMRRKDFGRIDIFVW